MDERTRSVDTVSPMDAEEAVARFALRSASAAALEPLTRDPTPRVGFAAKVAVGPAEHEEPPMDAVPDVARKSRHVATAGLQASCLLDQFLGESADLGDGADPAAPRTPTQRSTAAFALMPGTPPQTPPRATAATRTPQSKPPRPWSPPKPKRTGGLSKALVPCTPPRQGRPNRTVHNPYIVPGTPPPPSRSPAAAAAAGGLQASPGPGPGPAFALPPNLRASPKPRTPTRTRRMVQSLNTPSPGAALVNTPGQARLSLALGGGTPTAAAGPPTPAHGDTSLLLLLADASPAANHRDPAVVAVGAAHPPPSFLQYSVGDSLPPSLQTPTSSYSSYHLLPEEQLQYGYGAQSAALNDLLQSGGSPLFPSPFAGSRFVHIQRGATGSPVVTDPGVASPASLGSLFGPSSCGPSPTFTSAGRPFVNGSPTVSPAGGPRSGAVFPHHHSRGRNSRPLVAVPDKFYALVEFKRGRVVQFQCPFAVQPGQFLVVEGDEGEDLGMVTNFWVAAANATPVVNNSLNSHRTSDGRDVDPLTGFPVYPSVLRHASSREVHHLHNAQAQAEIRCTEEARHKVAELQLPMTIVDAEYQFDRKKLTFYYEAEERVDFRDLLTNLFRLYRARIWMSKILPPRQDRRPR